MKTTGESSYTTSTDHNLHNNSWNELWVISLCSRKFGQEGLTLNENEGVPMINKMFINCTIILSQFDKRHYQYICSSQLEDNLETPRTIKKHI